MPLSTTHQWNFVESGESMKSEVEPGPAGEPAHWSPDSTAAGLLIVNADDWGRDHETTERTFECILRGAVSSVSAMVFMGDSERAAGIPQEKGSHRGPPS